MKCSAQSLVAYCGNSGASVSFLTRRKNSLRDLVRRAHLEPILECLKNHMDSFRRDLPLELPTVRHFQELQNHGMTLGQ